MSFLERKATEWTWSEEEDQLELKDSSRWVILIFTIIFFLPSFIVFVVSLWRGEFYDSLLYGLVAIPTLIVWSIFSFSLSLDNKINLSDIQMAVTKDKDSFQTISLKLVNGRYRQLYFKKRSQYERFLKFLEDKIIPVEERSLYWSLPINY